MEHRVQDERPPQSEVLDLYRSVGWSAYTDEPDTLAAALAASHAVLTVRSTGDGRLLGLARTLSDDHTIVFLQDILVRPEHHRAGVGGSLLDAVLDRYRHVRQLVLLTDDEPTQRRFYESRGLSEVHDARPQPLRCFTRL